MGTVERLKHLGFAANEAKAYLALLGCQPASAYEIAKQAGLPTSKIYETVSKLTDRGILQFQVDESGNQQYFAMDPADLMERIRTSTISETEILLADLQRVPTTARNNLVWPLTDTPEIQGRVQQLIERATRTILISLWPEELRWCEALLRDAEQRGVQIALVHFGEPAVDIGATYHHPAERTLYQEKGGRGLTVVTDSSNVVIANYLIDGRVEGTWSRNESFVTVAEDYIKHDVYITKVTRFLRPEVIQRFGEDYARLRDVFNADA